MSSAILNRLRWAGLMLCAAQGVFAQQSVLANDPVGSPPYREAVRRFLEHKEPKIVGGKLAPFNAYPWQASVGVSWIADPYYAHFCGGSVIAPTWILTAAHCMRGLTPEKVSVTAGTNVLGVGGARVNVKRIIVRSDYRTDTQDNDIALAELYSPLPIGERIATVALQGSAEGQSIAGTALTVVGWGSTNEGGTKVRDLRYVEVPYVDNAECNRAIAYDGRVTDGMLCAGRAVGGTDSCQGDSGGPLTLSLNGIPTLVGVVSWGEGCARPNKYGVYARVPKYSAWVAECVAKPETCP